MQFTPDIYFIFSNLEEKKLAIIYIVLTPLKMGVVQENDECGFCMFEYLLILSMTPVRILYTIKCYEVYKLVCRMNKDKYGILYFLTHQHF
jgi:hypothetical protein